jgi:hypothetical protein
VTKSKRPFLIRILAWFAALASAGMYLSIVLAILDIGPHIMVGERVTREEWLHIAAPLVAVIGVLMAWDLLRIRNEKNMVASRCDCDVWANRCLRDEPWRTDYDSSRDHVACYYQRYFVWRRLGLVFLF